MKIDGSQERNSEITEKNSICERFQKTVLQEFYQITFLKYGYQPIEELCRRRAVCHERSEVPGGPDA
jgi:hypothetical protein